MIFEHGANVNFLCFILVLVYEIWVDEEPLDNFYMQTLSYSEPVSQFYIFTKERFFRLSYMINRKPRHHSYHIIKIGLVKQACVQIKITDVGFSYRLYI